MLLRDEVQEHIKKLQNKYGGPTSTDKNTITLLRKLSFRINRLERELESLKTK